MIIPFAPGWHVSSTLAQIDRQAILHVFSQKCRRIFTRLDLGDAPHFVFITFAAADILFSKGLPGMTRPNFGYFESPPQPSRMNYLKQLICHLIFINFKHFLNGYTHYQSSAGGGRAFIFFTSLLQYLLKGRARAHFDRLGLVPNGCIIF